MSLILARSPYFIGRGNLDDNASLTLDIGYYDSGDSGFVIEKTYLLSFRNAYILDISPLIRDYLQPTYTWVGISGYVKSNDEAIKYIRATVSGEVNGVAVSDVEYEGYASSGYLYSTDDYNEDLTLNTKQRAWVANSTDIVYKLDDAELRIPFLQTELNLISGGSSTYEDVFVSKYYRGELIETENISIFFDSGLSSGSYYIYSTRGDDNISFKDRVSNDDGVLEENLCYEKFFREKNTGNIDELVISSESGFVKKIKVKTIEECKHNPYRVTFINRYGVEEDLWFFKRSDESVNITKETYRSNSIARYNNGDSVKTFTDFNKNGVEKFVLNSGFVEEEMKEAFRQLLLSEEVTLYDFNKDRVYEVNIATSELQYKQHVNDKLINYTIEFEFAHEVINNVG